MPDRTCLHCGASFVQIGNGRPRRWCYDCLFAFDGSPEYNRRAVQLDMFVRRGNVHAACCGIDLRPKKPSVDSVIRVCVICSVPVPLGRRTTCGSSECVAANGRRHAKRQRTVKSDKWRATKRKWARARAKRKWQQKAALRPFGPPSPRQCAHCEAVVHLPKRVCDQCLAANNRAHAKKYKAAKRGAAVRELIDLNEIAERDGWRCHLCRKPVNPNAKALKHKASIDHLVPLSKGGHGTSWLQCA